MFSQLPDLSSLKPQLFRGILSDTNVKIPFSPAGQQATRLAACPDGTFIFATGTKAHQITCAPSRKRTRPQSDIVSHSNMDPIDAQSVESPIAIADDYIVPRPFASISASTCAIHSAHCSEIQSVTTDAARIATVDAYGRGIVTVSHSGQPNNDTNHNATSQLNSFVLNPISLSNGDPGWCGIALRKNDTSSTAVCRQHFRDATIFDADVPVRTIYPLLPPTAMSFCGKNGTLALTEGADLSFYDCRAGESGACTGRKRVASGNLQAIDVSEDGNTIAISGTDRTLCVFDARMMGVRDRWPACLKYECAGVLLSSDMRGMAYACSVDNEVACGAWNCDIGDLLSRSIPQARMLSGAAVKSKRRAFGFRADVRISGFTKSCGETGEEIAAVSEAGSFYILKTQC